MSAVKPQTYLRTLLNSFSSPRYYLDILNAPLQFSFRFFLISYVLLALLHTGVFYFTELPKLKEHLAQATTEFRDHFPQDLELNWTGEKFETTTSRPVAVQYPSFIPRDNLPKSFGFFVPELKGPEEITQALPTSAWWVANKEIVYVSDGGGVWSPLPLRDLPGFMEPFTLNKGNIGEKTEQWRTVGQQILHLSVFFFPAGFFFLIGTSRLLSLLIDTVLAYLLIRGFNRYFHFWKIFQIGLHILVVAEFAQLVFPLLVPNYTAPIFMMTFWAYFIFVLTTLWNVKKVEPKSVESESK